MDWKLLILICNCLFGMGIGNCIKNGYTKTSPYWNKSPYHESCKRGTKEFMCRNKFEDTKIIQCTRYAWCEKGVEKFGNCKNDEWFDSCKGEPNKLEFRGFFEIFTVLGQLIFDLCT